LRSGARRAGGRAPRLADLARFVGRNSATPVERVERPERPERPDRPAKESV
jgi:hypothetical protein